MFLALCLLTYSPADVGWLSSSPQRPTANLGGAVGAWVGFLGRGGFGWASLLLPLLCFLWAWRMWRAQLIELHATPFVIAVVCLMASAATLFALQGSSDTARTAWGGVCGLLLARAGTYYLGTVGTMLTALCAGLLSWLIVSGQTLRAVGHGVVALLTAIRGLVARRPKDASLPASPLETESFAAPRATRTAPSPAQTPEPSPAAPRVRIRPATVPTPKKPSAAAVRPEVGGFQLPPLELLASPPPISERQLAEDLQVNAKVLVETLREFGIEASVANIDRGPTVTRYELIPAPGVKLTKIVSLADDLALVLKAASCHVVAPIPGKGRVGIDVPNTTTTIVSLKEILSTPDFQQHSSVLALPIGKDVSGQAIITDLRECPHLLIAGATGSGKTVSLNSLLVGLLSRASPEQVQFLMIDPKMVELAIFNDIPHLAAPVVTNAKKASATLHWAVQEMERRYQLLAKASVRNIDAYNARAAQGTLPAAAEGGEEPPNDGRPLPYLLIVIDELADLMMVASQDVEGAITRLAQLSRAVGLHMILATQRPSVDVITGVIKANFPARIAFQVASKVDSRTILDMNGADKLLGRGDLLFLRPGTAKPIRAQGAFVTDAEIERVTGFLKQQRAPSYNEQLMEQQRQPEGALITEKDELYEMAKQIVLDTGQASTSLLQRRLRLGYGRAARILDLMEQEGLIGPPQGSRPREILVSRDAT
jgi:S-DNA-T family DNA segregation ATPase FtsK/SpoIIIE